MKSDKLVEVVLVSRNAPEDPDQKKELVIWIGTTLQRSISLQEQNTKRLFFTQLKNSEPISLS